jgi:hypothetical protein
MFSQFHTKATKSRSRYAFSFALREIRLLGKKKPFPGSNHLVWLLVDKRQTKYTLKYLCYLIWNIKRNLTLYLPPVPLPPNEPSLHTQVPSYQFELNLNICRR